jgi:hypothetical protein
MKYNIELIKSTLKKNIATVRWTALFVLVVWFLIAQIQVVPGLLARVALIVGLLLLALDLAFEWRSILSFFTGKAARKGLRFSATLFLTAALLGMLYYVFVRHVIFRVDMTSNQRFSLSEQTLLALEELEEPVKFWIFKMEVPHNAHPQMAQEINFFLSRVSEMENILRDYGRRNSLVSFEIVDIQQEREYAEEFGVREPFVVVVTAGKKNRHIRPNEYLVPQQRGQPVGQYEEVFTTAIRTLTRQTTWTIVFTSGHLERDPYDGGSFGYSRLNELLEKEGFTVISTNLLLAGGVPEECDLLILAGPRDDLHPQKIEYIENYLMQGRAAFFLANRESKPNYRALVSRWGVDIGIGSIYDREKFVGDFFGRVTGFIPNIEHHRVTRALIEDTQRQIILTLGTVPLSQSAFARNRVDEATGAAFAPYIMNSLLTSTANAWEEPDLRAARLDASKRRGPFNAAFIITIPPLESTLAEVSGTPLVTAVPHSGQTADVETVTQAGPAQELNIAVFGDSDFVANGYGQPGNLELFLATVNWALGQADRIVISPKAPLDYPIHLTKGEDNFIKYFAIVVMPLIVIICGTVVYFRRKRYGA